MLCKYNNGAYVRINTPMFSGYAYAAGRGIPFEYHYKRIGLGGGPKKDLAISPNIVIIIITYAQGPGLPNARREDPGPARKRHA